MGLTETDGKVLVSLICDAAMEDTLCLGVIFNAYFWTTGVPNELVVSYTERASRWLIFGVDESRLEGPPSA